MIVLFAFIAVLVGLDAAADLRTGGGSLHVALEVSVVAIALVGVAFLVRQLVQMHREAQDLQREVAAVRDEAAQHEANAARYRAEAKKYLAGLGEVIDQQFARWGLSPAEREIGVLLLKGLSLKEIAVARGTSERTVRQQSLAIYRKASVAGRAELSAFFLEDLLLPASRPGAS